MSSRKALDLRTDGPPVAAPFPAFLCVLCPVTTAFPRRLLWRCQSLSGTVRTVCSATASPRPLIRLLVS